MNARTLIAPAAALLLLAAPLFAAAPVPGSAGKATEGPPVVLQVAPIGLLIDDIKAMVKSMGGDSAADEITQAIQGKLGEKGFAGIDTKRPMAAYLYLPDKIGLAEKNLQQIDFEQLLRKFKGALVIPITKPDEFKEFAGRLFDGKVAIEPVAGKEGLFKLDSPREPAPFPIRIRFHADHAYLGLNLSDDEMDAKSLVAIEALVNPKETSQLVLRAFPDRYPPDLMKESMDAIDRSFDEIKKNIGKQELAFVEKAMSGYVKMAKRYSDQLMKEASELGYRTGFEKASGEFATEFYIHPKKGTSLAADIAARKPSTNKFASLVSNDAVGGIKLQAPLFAEEIKEILLGLIEEGQKRAKEHAPPPAQPVLDELLQGLARTIKTGELDAAGAVYGPDKDGHYTAVAAIAFEDAGKLEAALKAAAKDAPKEVQDAVKFDVAKIGEIAVHKITPPEEPPPEFAKIFGSNAIHVAFGPKGIYAAYGTEAQEALKKALAAKPGESKAFDATLNPKRLHTLLAAAHPQSAEAFEKMIGKEDKTVSLLSVILTGGESLRVRYTINMKYMPRAIAGSRAVAQPPVAIPVKD